jgi:NTP pyrophosphatase (non-canonical NTP hydrolase)
LVGSGVIKFILRERKRMIEKEVELMKKISNVLSVTEMEVLNTSFVDIMEMLMVKLEVDQKRMKMNQYQDLTARTAPHFDDLVEEITAWTMGIAGESGEIADFVKKAVWHKHPWDHEKLAYELGDLMFYISRLANVIGYSLDEIAVMNIKKLYRRYPDGFSPEASLNRRDEK